MSSLPSKLFFRIGEVAGLVGVEPHVLRYWEREFRSVRPTKSAKGQRVYSRKDVENLLRVRDLLYRDGFTIAGAKKRLQRGAEAPAAEPSDTSEAVSTTHELSAEPEEEEEERTPTEMVADVIDEPTPSRAQKLAALRAEVEAFLDELEPLGHERA